MATKLILITLVTVIFFAAAVQLDELNGPFGPTPVNGVEEIGPSIAGSIEDRARFEQVRLVLEVSPKGRALLDEMTKYDVQVWFEAGAGSRFRQSNNTIFLDSNHGSVKAALMFAHEMHHARTLHEGLKADMNSSSRQAYVEQKLQEEVDAVVASIELKMELEAMNVNLTGVTLPYSSRYELAYERAVRQLDLTLNEEIVVSLGQEAGRRTLVEAFTSGEVKTSNTIEPYPDYYGRDWDEAHPDQDYS